MNVASDHDEVLRPPVLWWFLALFFGGSIGWALGFFYSELASLIGLALAVTIIAVGLSVYGSVRVRTTDSHLHAGKQRIDWEHVGQARVLDATQTHRRLGVEADTSASLVVRPYVPTSVEVRIDDANDPHPYWLISTRDPEHLLAAITHRTGQ